MHDVEALAAAYFCCELPGQWTTSVPVTKSLLRICSLPFVSEVSMLLSHGADQGRNNTRLNWSSS